MNPRRSPRRLLCLVCLLALSWPAGSARGSDPVASSVRVRGASNDGQGFYCASGTAVAPEWVVTNQHVVRDSVPPFDVNGRPARVIAADPSVDLALLHVPGAEFAASELAELDPRGPQPGLSVTHVGFGSGELAVMRGRVLASRAYMDPSFAVPVVKSSALIRQGDSGGGVFDDAGRLVAVQWGCSDATSAVSTHYVAQMMQQCGPYGCPPPRRRAAPQPAPTPRPAPQPEPSGNSGQLADCRDRCQALAARIECLEQRAPVPGPPGPPGERGPAGPPGRDGACPEPAPPAAIDQQTIEQAIVEQLRKKLRITVTRTK